MPKGKNRKTVKKVSKKKSVKKEICGYKLADKKPLGSGTYGEVWLAHESPKFEREGAKPLVAIKKQKLSKKDREEIAREGIDKTFLVEGSVNAILSEKPHPNVFASRRIEIDCTEKQLVPLILSDRVNGTLDDYVREKSKIVTKLTSKRKRGQKKTKNDDNDSIILLRSKFVQDMTLLYNIYCGLEWMHRNGWLHHDLRADNIFLAAASPNSNPNRNNKNKKKDETSVPKIEYEGSFVAQVADFGLVDRIESLSANRAHWRHTPPEVLCNKQWTIESEMWALGVMAYKLFFLDRLVKINDESYSNTMKYKKEILHAMGKALIPSTDWIKKNKTCAKEIISTKKPTKKTTTKPSTKVTTKTTLKNVLELQNKWGPIYGEKETQIALDVTQRLLSFEINERRINFEEVFRKLRTSVPKCLRPRDLVVHFESPTAIFKDNSFNKFKADISFHVNVIASTIWKRLKMLNLSKYGSNKNSKPTETQRLAIILIASKLLKLESPAFDREINSQRKKIFLEESNITKDLNFNFFGASNKKLTSLSKSIRPNKPTKPIKQTKSTKSTKSGRAS